MKAKLTVVVLLVAGTVSLIPTMASAHGFVACGAGVNVKVYNVTCNQAYKVLGRYIGSGFRDHKRHGWRCHGSFPSDGPGGLPGKVHRRSQTVNCTRNRRSKGHQHIRAKS